VGIGRPRNAWRRAGAYIRLTEVYWFANDVPALVHAGIRALNLAERAGPSPELARAHAIICLASGSIPLHPIARGYARRAEQTARRAGQLWPLAYVRFITSVYHIGAARWQQVQEALEEAEALFERLGDRRLLGDTWSVQGLLALYRGQFDPAGATFAKLYERGASNETVQHQVWACIGWAECELRAGRAGEAARLLETALILLTEHPDQAEQVRGIRPARRGAAAPRRGDGRAGGSRLGRTTDRPIQATDVVLPARRLRRVAEVYLDQWEAGDRALPTRQAARQACSALRTFARVFPIGQPRAQLWSGRLHHLSGRPERAQRAWRASLSAAQRLGMPFEAARAHVELGRRGDGQPQRQWHLQQAQSLLRELGVVQRPPLEPPAR
jgi:tetratricopeptide (TPR) repeat protein